MCPKNKRFQNLRDVDIYSSSLVGIYSIDIWLAYGVFLIFNSVLQDEEAFEVYYWIMLKNDKSWTQFNV